jgi:hypothetical protein
MFQNQFEGAVSNVFCPKVPVPCANPITHNESSTLLDFAPLRELRNCLITRLQRSIATFCSQSIYFENMNVILINTVRNHAAYMNYNVRWYASYFRQSKVSSF